MKELLRFFDLQTPFFVPLWRRVLACALIAGWAGVELVSGNPGWAAVFGLAAAWLIWSLLITWTPPDQDE